MNREYILPAAIVAWFLVLAIAEALVAHRHGPRGPSSDGRLLTNFGLTAIVILFGSVFPLAGTALFGQRLGLGLAQNVALPGAIVVLLTLAALTFASYWTHRMMHAVPLFWRIHRVHHADGEVDVSTSFRNHPFELLLALPPAMIAVLIVGPSVEVLAAAQTLLSAAVIWEHADLPLPARVDRIIGGILVTPRLHRLHHSPERRTHDSNYGNFLMLWDQVFGTFNTMEGQRPVGLEPGPIRPDNLVDQIRSPFARVTAQRPVAS